MARIINEPTAAALAYGLGKKLHEKVAVFDLETLNQIPGASFDLEGECNGVYFNDSLGREDGWAFNCQGFAEVPVSINTAGGPPNL